MQYLQLTTTSKTGKKSPVKLLGAGTLTTSTGFNTPFNQVSVEISHTTGKGIFKSNVSHEKPFVSIWFEDGHRWVGSFDDLRDELKLAAERRAQNGKG